MQPVVYDHYRDFIFPKFPPPGKRILEVGALASPTQNLLSIFSSQNTDHELTGVNLEIPPVQPDWLNFKFLKCNANDMSVFTEDSFDAVICHGVLNNDRFFWKSLAEIRRVLRTGGIFYVGVPGFQGGGRKLQFKRILYRLGAKSRHRNLERLLISLAENTWLSAIPTYHYSPTPQDYYRFSGDAVKEVLMEGCDLLHFEAMLYPPRLFAVGRNRE